MSRSLGAGFPVALWGYVYRPDSLGTPASNSCDRSLCTSSRPSFLRLFSVSGGSCSGFHRSSPHVLPLLFGTGFSVYLLTSNTESCDDDDDEKVDESVIEELVDKPGTTNGT